MTEESSQDLDRRGFRRINTRYPIKIEVGDQSVRVARGFAVNAVTVDISRGGLQARLDTSIPEGSHCFVRFFGAEGCVSPEMIVGKVHRLKREPAFFIVGIEFDTPLEILKLPVGKARQEDLGTKRVLVADDERYIRVLFDRLLSEWGYQVETAKDGQEALETLRRERIDALLLDLYMPKLSGLEVLGAISAEGLEVGLICAMSGYGDDDAAHESLRLGADDFIAKPVDPEYLQWRLGLWLAAKSENRGSSRGGPIRD